MKKVFAILYEPQENGNITLSFYDIESGELLKVLDFGDIYDQKHIRYNPETKKNEVSTCKNNRYREGAYYTYFYVKFNSDIKAMINYFAEKYGFQAVIPERVMEPKLESLTETITD
jgi:hypothetical protein